MALSRNAKVIAYVAAAASVAGMLSTTLAAGPSVPVDNTVVEAESLAIAPSDGRILEDSDSSGGAALQLLEPAAVTATLNGAVTRIVIRARGRQCAGSPRMRIPLRRPRPEDATCEAQPLDQHELRARRTGRGRRTQTLDRIRRAEAPPRLRSQRPPGPHPVRHAARHRADGDSTGGPAPAVAPQSPPTASAAASGPNRMAGDKLYVDPTSYAAAQATALRLLRPADAALLDKIAGQPQAVWVTGHPDDVRTVDVALRGAASSGARTVFAIYALPERDCGQYAAGGLTEPGYRAWLDGIVAHIGSRPAVAIIEPDALGQITCLNATAQAVRYSLMNYAISKLAALSDTLVYVDAANSAWYAPADMVERLKAAGVAAADGIAVNTANFNWASDEMTYGRALGTALGGKHMVIDTSRNGNGPVAPGSSTDAREFWCNPVGRALGARPTTVTGVADVDAYLWVKRPGETDGPCHGGPAQGFFTEGALALARSAKW